MWHIRFMKDGGVRPNVLLITLDQFRGDCLSSAGHPIVRTPQLDRLAANGVRFARHYSQASPCGPGRASLYTGMYLMNHRSVLNGTPLDARHTNVALMARGLGYEPALFGYTDTSVDPRTVGADDPRLRDYEGVLPGFDPVGYLPEGNPAAWVDWMRAAGEAVPDEWRQFVDLPQKLSCVKNLNSVASPALKLFHSVSHCCTSMLNRSPLPTGNRLLA
jgi:arylsulfatase A-like enzyme